MGSSAAIADAVHARDPGRPVMHLLRDRVHGDLQVVRDRRQRR